MAIKHKLLYEFGTKEVLEELLDKLALEGWRVNTMHLTKQVAGGHFLLEAVLENE